jgi:hypothetical protein
MDKAIKINGSKIINIIKVMLENILLELYFNIEYANEKFSLKMSISDDGESILFSKSEKGIHPNAINYQAYEITEVNNSKDELSKLIGTQIMSIQLGIGKTLNTNEEVVYYARITTNENEFLFFNNGDEGAYSFDKIDAILQNDIYGYQWVMYQ